MMPHQFLSVAMRRLAILVVALMLPALAVASPSLPANIDPKKFNPHQFGMLGQKGEVLCSFIGDPKPTVAWFFTPAAVGVETEVSNGGRYTIEEGKLTIAALTADDEGYYRCELSQGQGANSYRMNVYVRFNVVTKPAINAPVTLDPVAPVEGKALTVTCAADEGEPQPIISFKKVMADGSTTAVDDSLVKDGTLTFANTKLTDKGTYRCIATNIGGNATADITFEVQAPPRVEVYNGDAELVENKPHTLKCIAKGNPAPTVEWMGPQGELGDDVPTIENNSDQDEGDDNLFTTVHIIAIKKLTREHNGGWKCVATNDAGTIEKTVMLKVKSSPRS